MNAVLVSILIATAPAQPVEAAQERETVVRKLLSPDMFYYTTAKDELTPADLPILYDILNDLASYEAWGNTAMAIGFLGESDESYKAITAYVKRPQRFGELDHYEEIHQSTRSKLLMDKISAIRWLPFLNNKSGTNTLRTILSDKKFAESYLEDWIDEEIPSGFGDIRRAAMQLRAAAAAGLIFHDCQANLPAVQKQFEVLDRLYEEIPDPTEVEVSDDQMLQNGYTAMLQSSLVEVFVIAEYINEHSVEQYFAKSGSYELRQDIRFRFSKMAYELGIYD